MELEMNKSMFKGEKGSCPIKKDFLENQGD